MASSNSHSQRLGLNSCFASFETAYCYRKLIEFVLSCLFMVAAVAILGLFVRKHWLTRPYFLSALLLVLILSLISNICFCFYNSDYWIYSVEVFLKNVYYLILVSYICHNYLLKQTAEEKEDLMQQLNINMNISSSRPRNRMRILFYVLLALAAAGYLCILIASIIYELRHQAEERVDPDDSDSSIKYCSETWYLILRVFCIFLSIVAVIAMVRIQQEEYKKIIKFKQEQSQIKRAQLTRIDSPHNSTDSSHLEEKPLTAKEKVHNPFRNLWAWVGINAISQVVNLIQSGFELNTVPPQCLIIPSNPNGSNVVALIIVLITFYLGSGATLWYILYVKTLHNRTSLDRTNLYSEEYNAQGNIELFVPSRGQTVTLSIPQGI